MTHHAGHVLAEIAVEPTVEGTAHGELIKRAIEARDGPDFTLEVGPLSTTVEGGIEDVLHAVERAHKTAADSAERVITTVRIESKKEGLDLRNEKRGIRIHDRKPLLFHATWTRERTGMDIGSTLPLSTGRVMSAFGLGTWELTEETARAVAKALSLGDRMIDTSGDYGTQTGIGQGIPDRTGHRSDAHTGESSAHPKGDPACKGAPFDNRSEVLVC